MRDVAAPEAANGTACPRPDAVSCHFGLLHVMCLHAHTSNAIWHVVLVVVLLLL